MDNIYTKKQCDLIAKNVKYLAGKKGWSLNELSKQCGLSITTLSLFVNRYKNLKICNLQKVAQALEVDLEILKTKQY